MAFRVPEIGQWYIDLQLGQHFEVIALDDHSRTVELQYVDGEVSEVDLESWRGLAVELAAAPEDWSASYEVSREDNPLEDFSGDDLLDPLSSIESELFEGSEPY